MHLPLKINDFISLIDKNMQQDDRFAINSRFIITN